MMTHKRPLVLLALAALVALPGAAEEVTGSFTGSFELGFRSVDVSGNGAKYDEDFGLEDGPRLFDFRIDFTPEKGQRGFADKVELSAANLGGDPFETIRFGLRKYGSYDFRYDRRKSNYFYADTILPHELSNPRLSNGGDFHTFDFDRVQDSAQLDLNLSRAAKLSFGFDRFTKKGESTTTLDIQRDEFELDRPIDESMDEYRAGFQYSWSKVTLYLDESIREYKNAVELFLPGFSVGEDPNNQSVLDFFFLDQPYDFTSYEHKARVLWKPHSRFQILLSALLQNLDLDVEAAETSRGRDFLGRPFSTDLTGEGELERDSELFDVDLSYQIRDHLAVTGKVWSHTLDQQGDFAFGTDDNVGRWDIETTGAEAGLQYGTAKLTLGGGLRFESRDVTHGAGEDGTIGDLEKESTDADGYFLTVDWRPGERFNMSVTAEQTSFDDPFTLSSPSDRLRARLRALYVLGPGTFLLGTYRVTQVENDRVNLSADTDQLGLQLVLFRPKFKALVGYGFINVERDVNQRTNVGTFPIFYDIESSFIDGHFHYQLNDRFAFGTDLRFYDNAGSYGLSRDDLRGYVEVTLGKYTVNLGYRTIDYNEDRLSFDDYDADIVQLSLGYRW